MISVLLAAAGVAPHGLQVAVVVRTDPDFGPGRGNRQATNSSEHCWTVDSAAGGVPIAEAPAAESPRETSVCIGNIAQAGGAGRSLGRKQPQHGLWTAAATRGNHG